MPNQSMPTPASTHPGALAGCPGVAVKGVFELDSRKTILEAVAAHQVLAPKPEEVQAYLADHPQLGELIPAICAHVRGVFGPGAELSLELYRDPEIDDRYLTLYVRQEKYAPEFLDAIEAVSHPFDDALTDVSGYFLVATDFRRPRGKHAV